MLFPASLILLLVFPLLIAHFYEGIEFRFRGHFNLMLFRALTKFNKGWKQMKFEIKQSLSKEPLTMTYSV